MACLALSEHNEKSLIYLMNKMDIDESEGTLLNNSIEENNSEIVD
jgi:hypothetical protein